MVSHILNYELFQRIITTIALSLVIGLPLLFDQKIIFALIMIGIFFFILFNEIPILSNNIVSFIFLSFYILLSICCIILLQWQFNFLALSLFVLVSSHDIGSYFIGIILGRSKISLSISPKKTWEGFFGGLLFNFFASLFFFRLTFFTIFLVFSISTVALLGDLLESFFKRLVNLKNSGNFLPGHGGFFDRFDSLFLVSLLFYMLKHKIVDLLILI